MSKEYCPDCGAHIKLTQCDQGICGSCDWIGDLQDMKEFDSLDNELSTTVDEWRAEMDALHTKASDPGLTNRELRAKLHLGRSATAHYIEVLTKAGKCKAGSAYRQDSTGRMQLVPVYQLTKGK